MGINGKNSRKTFGILLQIQRERDNISSELIERIIELRRHVCQHLGMMVCPVSQSPPQNFYCTIKVLWVLKIRLRAVMRITAVDFSLVPPDSCSLTHHTLYLRKKQGEVLFENTIF